MCVLKTTAVTWVWTPSGGWALLLCLSNDMSRAILAPMLPTQTPHQVSSSPFSVQVRTQITTQMQATTRAYPTEATSAAGFVVYYQPIPEQTQMYFPIPPPRLQSSKRPHKGCGNDPDNTQHIYRTTQENTSLLFTFPQQPPSRCSAISISGAIAATTLPHLAPNRKERHGGREKEAA